MALRKSLGAANETPGELHGLNPQTGRSTLRQRPEACLAVVLASDLHCIGLTLYAAPAVA
jgi:hypothetical protein